MVAPIRAGLLGTGHGHAAGKLNVMEQSDDYEVVGVPSRMRGGGPSASRSRRMPRRAGWTRPICSVIPACS